MTTSQNQHDLMIDVFKSVLTTEIDAIHVTIQGKALATSALYLKRTSHN